MFDLSSFMDFCIVCPYCEFDGSCISKPSRDRSNKRVFGTFYR